MRIAVCICFFLFCATGWQRLLAQEHQTVQLSPNLPEIQDSEDIRVVVIAADKLYPLHYDSARCLLQYAIKRSKELHYPKGLVHAYNVLGVAAFYVGDMKAGMAFYRKAQDAAISCNDKKMISIINNNIGGAYVRMGRYDLGLEYFYKALELAKRNPQSDQYLDSVIAYTNISVIWNDLEEWTEAYNILKEAVRVTHIHKDSLYRPAILNNIGSVCINLGKEDAAKQYLERALTLSNATNNRQERFSSLIRLATLYHGRKDYDKALLLCKEAMIDTAYVEHQVNTDAQICLGQILLGLNRIDEAKKAFTNALEKSLRYGLVQKSQVARLRLAEVSAAQGQYKEAYAAAEQFVIAKDSFQKNTKLNLVEITARSRMAARENELLLQRLKLEQKQVSLEKHNFWASVGILGSLLLLTACLGYIYYFRNKAARQRNELVQLKHTQEIQQLKAYIRGEEQERQRIATELHDGIASQLWAIRLHTDNLLQEETLQQRRSKLESIMYQLSEATADVRTTAHNLMPDLLLEAGLATALSSLCEKTSMQSGWEVDFQEYGNIPRFDKEIELSLYRMVQELLHNSLRHARSASQLLVQLSCVDALLSITVEDNGEIQAEDTLNEGVGLQQIRKRVKSLGGIFDFQHAVGKGTTAYLEFDIQHFL